MSKNPYAYGFWCLFLVIVVVGVAASFSRAAGPPWPSYADFYSGLTAWASLAQALTSVVLVVAAFLGVNEWKKQISHEKELNVVWETMAALRRVEVAFHDLQAKLFVHALDGDFDLNNFAAGHPIGGYIKTLEDQCVWMDKVVSDGDWHWVPQSGSLNIHISTYLLLHTNAPFGDRTEFATLMASRSEALKTSVNDFNNQVRAMDQELQSLKKKLG